MIALKEMGKKLADMSTKGLHHQRFRPIIAPLAFGSMVFLGTRANSWAAERRGKVEPLIEGLGSELSHGCRGAARTAGFHAEVFGVPRRAQAALPGMPVEVHVGQQAPFQYSPGVTNS